jgi:hypothetical protein
MKPEFSIEEVTMRPYELTRVVVLVDYLDGATEEVVVRVVWDPEYGVLRVAPMDVDHPLYEEIVDWLESDLTVMDILKHEYECYLEGL